MIVLGKIVFLLMYYVFYKYILYKYDYEVFIILMIFEDGKWNLLMNELRLDNIIELNF